uniref:Apple domain-containing protein n=1 Tax=Adineta vaga TaxID=104782 RepID=B3G4F0_ADIVA|nr:unknown [Adineta vaga]
MSLIIRGILILLLIYYSSAKKNPFHQSGKDYLYSKRLFQLLRQLQTNDNQQFLKRTSEGDCSADLTEGYKWTGKSTFYSYGIDSIQRCLDLCDTNEFCRGWSYEKETQLCDGMYDIRGVSIHEGVVSGSCAGNTLKVKCTEVQNGGFWGWLSDESLADVSDMETCMKACDEMKTCYGWLYAESEKTCSFFDNIGDFYESDYFKGGKCLGKQERIIVSDKIKIFRSEVLERHNLKRKEHCVSELTLDSTLNQISQDIAKKFADDDIAPPVYQGDKMINIYYTKSNAALHGKSILNKEKFYLNIFFITRWCCC